MFALQDNTEITTRVDWTLARCAELGNRLGALKIAQRGGQNHVGDRQALGL